MGVVRLRVVFYLRSERRLPLNYTNRNKIKLPKTGLVRFVKGHEVNRKETKKDEASSPHLFLFPIVSAHLARLSWKDLFSPPAAIRKTVEYPAHIPISQQIHLAHQIMPYRLNGHNGHLF